MHYNLPPWSISILPDCRNAVFNTAKVCNKSLGFKIIFLWYSGVTVMLPSTQFIPLQYRHQWYSTILNCIKPLNSSSPLLGWSTNISDANAADKYSYVIMGEI